MGFCFSNSQDSWIMRIFRKGSFVALLFLFLFASSQLNAEGALRRIRINYKPVDESSRVDEYYTSSVSITRERGTHVSIEIYRQTSMSEESTYSYIISGSRSRYEDSTGDSFYFYSVIDGNESDADVFCSVDPNGESGYERENLIVSVFSEVPEKADLVVDDITVEGTTSPRDYVVGETVEVECIVFNEGRGSADSSSLAYYIGTSQTSTSNRWESDGVSSLDYNEGSVESERYTFQASDVGRRYFVFEADRYDEIDEDSESNNKAYFGPFNVVDPPNQAPTVNIISGPSGIINYRTVTFSYAGADSDGTVSGFEIEMDGVGLSTESTSRTYYDLLDGPHSFRVRSIDDDGAKSAWVSQNFDVIVNASLTVSIEPSEAITAGARWRLTSGPDMSWKESGDSIANIPPGDYTLEFNQIDYWETPNSQVLTISSGVSFVSTGAYSPLASQIRLEAQSRRVRPGQKIKLLGKIEKNNFGVWLLKGGLTVEIFIDGAYEDSVVSTSELLLWGMNVEFEYTVPDHWTEGTLTWYAKFSGSDDLLPAQSSDANLNVSIPPWGSDSAPYGIIDPFPELENDDGISRSDLGYRYRYARFGVVLDHNNIAEIGSVAELNYPNQPSNIGDYRAEFYIMRCPLVDVTSRPELCFDELGDYIPWSELNVTHNSVDRTISISGLPIGYSYYLFRILHLDPERFDDEKDENGNAIDSVSKKLVIVIHGWNPNSSDDPFGADLNNLAATMNTWLLKSRPLEGWQVWKYKWGIDAATGPSTGAYPSAVTLADQVKSVDTWPTQNGTEAAEAGYMHGELLADYLLSIEDLKSVQMIAHSAGSWVAHNAAHKLLESGKEIGVQVTFLDPYMPKEGSADSALGNELIERLENDYSTIPIRLENYFSKWDEFVGSSAFLNPGTSQVFQLVNSFSTQQQLDYGDAEYLEEAGTYWSHSGPIRYYADSITNDVVQEEFWDSWFGGNHGWHLSIPYEIHNSPPSNINLSNTSVLEIQPVGTLVGILSATDPNVGDTFIYSMEDGIGGGDNALFEIEGDHVVTAVAFDYESRNQYQIGVKVTDQDGLDYNKVFNISIINQNERPTGLSLSNDMIEENNAAGSVVGALSTVDPDGDNLFEYTLESGVGDNGNTSFYIQDDRLCASVSFDFEMQNLYSVRIRSTDQGGLSQEDFFSVAITDVNEIPASAVRRDYDGDGFEDLLLQSSGSLAVYCQRLDGMGSNIGSELKLFDESRNQHLLGMYDLNGDEIADYIFRNSDSPAAYEVQYRNAAGEVFGSNFYIPQETELRLVGFHDQNKDGRCDLIWQNVNTGRVTVWFLNTSGEPSSSMILIDVMNDFRVVDVGDVDKDGNMDILWQHADIEADQSTVVLWCLDSEGQLKSGGSQTLGRVFDGWFCVGLADLNADGYLDIVWENRDSFEILTWLMDASFSQTGHFWLKTGATNSLYANWQWEFYRKVASACDVDGEGNADLLWQHETNASLEAWLMDGSLGVRQTNSLVDSDSAPGKLAALSDMNGDGINDLLWTSLEGAREVVTLWERNPDGTIARSILLGKVAAPYFLKGVGDLNGDGCNDLIWQDENTGKVITWYMDGHGNQLSYTALTGAIPIYKVKLIEDMNSDGNDDILWQGAVGSKNRIIIWFMDGNGVRASFVNYTEVDGVWSLSCAGDFNEDGDTDLIWYNESDGQAIVWLLDENNQRSSHQTIATGMNGWNIGNW